jgi:GNAT superfamily N-acetyltransferase
VDLRLEAPVSTRHYEDWAQVLERVSGDLFAVEELEHTFRSDTKSLWLLAYRGDEAVGSAVGRSSSIRGSLYAMARVVPEARRLGVGSALHAALCGHARDRGLTSLWGRILEDDSGSREFARNRGFEEVGRQHEVVVDVAEVEAAAAPPAGIELVTLADRPDLERAVYAVDAEVAPDVPGHDEGHDQAPFERWHAEYLEGPGALPEALVVALAGDDVVGYTGLRRRGSISPVAENMLTAVRAPWRRRGIATALKREQISRARKAGIERIFTTNDEENAAMRGVNAALGYRPAPVEILVRGPLPT